MVHKCRQAVILAAGMGKRLNLSIPSDKPKSLFIFNGKSLIERNIDLLTKNGVKEIIVVGGYKIDMLKDHLSKYKNVTVIENKNYDKYQTAYSMSLAYKFIDSCFIQTEGDLVFEELALKELLNSSGNSMVHSQYRDTNSISVPQFYKGKLIYFNRELKYRKGIQQPPNFTGPSHFTKEMLRNIKYYDKLKNNKLLYEEAVAISVYKHSIPLSFLYIPKLRYWDLNTANDYKPVSNLINTLDEEA